MTVINKKTFLIGTWALVAVIWAVLGTTFFVTDNTTTAVVSFTIALIATEVAFWLTALTLGIALVDARKSVWRMLRGGRTA